MGKISNYHRFYASLNRLPGGNTEDMKETLVSSFTDGRTIHLHEMTQKEYVNDFCRNPKIAGKEFAQLGVKDLDALQVKLRAIMRRGGLKKREEPKVAAEPQHTEPLKYVMAVPLPVMGNA